MVDTDYQEDPDTSEAQLEEAWEAFEGGHVPRPHVPDRPLIHAADPELDKLLAQEAEIEASARAYSVPFSPIAQMDLRRATDAGIKTGQRGATLHMRLLALNAIEELFNVEGTGELHAQQRIAVLRALGPLFQDGDDD